MPHSKRSGSRPIGRQNRQESRRFFLYISPWIIGFLCFMCYPVVYSLILAFTDTKIITMGQFVGLRNFVEAFTRDDYFWASYRNTFIYAFVSIPLNIVAAFLIALLLNQKLRGINIFRTFFYIPYVISGIAMTIVWSWILNPQFGLLNNILRLFGIRGPNWLSDPNVALFSFVLISMWHIGSTIIILLASLQDVPRDVYESAEIDGATGFTKMWRITLPIITPTLYFNIMMGIIGAFQMFNEPMILTEGGPANATYTIMLHIYNESFSWHKMGYASALSLIFFIVVMSMTLLYNWSSKRWVFYNN